MTMSAFGLCAVVERIVNFPCGVGVRVTQKRVFGGQKGCNITWGYVAWMDRGTGGGQILGGVWGTEG